MEHRVLIHNQLLEKQWVELRERQIIVPSARVCPRRLGNIVIFHGMVAHGRALLISTH